MNRPTRITLIGMAVVLMTAVWINFAKSAAGQEFDLACAISAAAEVATTVVGTEERNAALQVNFYYMGRLSGRDSDTYWSAVVKGKVAELRGNSKSPEMYGRCMAFLMNQM